MNSFELYCELFQNSIELNGKEAIDYFNDFFANDENDSYYFENIGLRPYEKKAIAELFKQDENIYERANNALKYDSCCFIAIMIISKYYDDEDELYNFYKECYINVINKSSYTRIGRDNATLFCSVFADWLLGYGDIEYAIEVEEKLFEIANRIDATMTFRYITSLERHGDIDKIASLVEHNINMFQQFVVCVETMNILVNNGYEYEALDLLDIYETKMKKYRGNDLINAEALIDKLPQLKKWIETNAKTLAYKA